MNQFLKIATGESIQFIAATLSSAIDQWLWAFNATLPDLASLNKLKPVKSLRGDYVEVMFRLGTTDFALVIEASDDNGLDSFQVVGRSKTVFLAEPYAAYLTKTWSATTAKTIAQELCNNAGITLHWDVQDWHIKTYIAEKRYPIDIISDLAGDLGAAVQSLPDGSLAIVYYPICSPNKLADYPPDYQLSTDRNIFDRPRKFINNKNFNAVLITPDSAVASSPSVTIEEVEDGIDRLLRISTQPQFLAASYLHIQHSGGSGIAISYEGSYTKTETEEIAITQGTGQLIKNFQSLVSATWHSVPLAEFAIDANGAITTDSGAGLVTVIYQSRYHQYRVRKLNSAIDKTLFSIADIPPVLDLSAASAHVVIGDGANAMPPVVVKTLSALPDLLARGQADLWPQLYDAEEYAIDCPYEGVPMLSGKVEQVRINYEDLTFKGWIKSVSITQDTTVKQSVTVVRPLS